MQMRQLIYLLAVLSLGTSRVEGKVKDRDILPQEQEVNAASEESARLISREIESQVQDQTGSEQVRVRFDPRCLALLAAMKEDVLRVEQVAIDPQRHRFTVTISTPGRLKPLVLKGGFSLSVRIPFVVRTIAPGEVIQEDDLSWNTVELGSGLRNAILRSEDLIEKTPRQKHLEPGQVIRANDIQKPILVRKNEVVAVIYQKNGLTIEQQGKSLDEGGAGDTVRVLAAGRKPIFGTVTAKKQVQIGDIPKQERAV